MSFARKPLAAAGIVVALATAAFAHSFKLGAIEIGHPWMPPASGATATVNFALANQGTELDRLVGAATPIGQAALLDAAEAPMNEIPLMPHRPIALRAGHPHVALSGLAKPLAAGASFPLTLQFAKAGAITVTVLVEAVPSD